MLGIPTYNNGVRLSEDGKNKINQLAKALEPLGVPVHITSGDRTAQEQAKVLLSIPNLNAYGETTRKAFEGKPRDLATWTGIVSALQAKGVFNNDHMAGKNADIRVRDLDDRQRENLLIEARKIFSYVGKITNHLHVGWK